MRQHSTDRPAQVPNSRIGVVRAQVNATLYRVTIDNATVSAHWAGSTAKTRGERVQVRFDPEKRYWSIAP